MSWTFFTYVVVVFYTDFYFLWKKVCVAQFFWKLPTVGGDLYNDVAILSPYVFLLKDISFVVKFE